MYVGALVSCISQTAIFRHITTVLGSLSISYHGVDLSNTLKTLDHVGEVHSNLEVVLVAIAGSHPTEELSSKERHRRTCD